MSQLFKFVYFQLHRTKQTATRPGLSFFLPIRKSWSICLLIWGSSLNLCFPISGIYMPFIYSNYKFRLIFASSILILVDDFNLVLYYSITISTEQ